MKTKLILAYIFILVTCLKTSEAKISFELQNKKLFDNDIDGHYCEELIINGKFVKWVTQLKSTSEFIVFRICEQEKEPLAWVSTKGAIYGGVSKGWFIIDKQSSVLDKICAPNFNYYSNPSYCGDYMAYWNSKNYEDWYGIVFNLGTKKIVNQVELGKLALETDNKYHLIPGKWKNGCESVVFTVNKYIRQKLLLKFDKNEKKSIYPKR